MVWRVLDKGNIFFIGVFNLIVWIMVGMECWEIVVCLYLFGILSFLGWMVVFKLRKLGERKRIVSVYYVSIRRFFNIKCYEFVVFVVLYFLML